MVYLKMSMILCGLSAAAVYSVGDSIGWTIGHVDYHKWANSKIFHAGDTLGKGTTVNLELS